jgi:hypothetical protein
MTCLRRNHRRSLSRGGRTGPTASYLHCTVAATVVPHRAVDHAAGRGEGEARGTLPGNGAARCGRVPSDRKYHAAPFYATSDKGARLGPDVEIAEHSRECRQEMFPDDRQSACGQLPDRFRAGRAAISDQPAEKGSCLKPSARECSDAPLPPRSCAGVLGRSRSAAFPCDLWRARSEDPHFPRSAAGRSLAAPSACPYSRTGQST